MLDAEQLRCPKNTIANAGLLFYSIWFVDGNQKQIPAQQGRVFAFGLTEEQFLDASFPPELLESP